MSQRHLDAARSADQGPFRVTSDVVFGSPAKGIVDYARDHGINLIVMGTHGQAAWRICCSAASQSGSSAPRNVRS